MTFKRLDKTDYRKLMGIENETDTNQNHLTLRFLDFEENPDFITRKLGLEPQSFGQKGEEYFIGAEKKISRIRECNYWDYEWKINSNEFIGDMIDKFFDEIIIPRLETIKEISETCKIIRLIIVQYYYTGNNPGYGFEKEQIKILAEINAEIDMDIYCLCEDKDKTPNR